MTQATRILVVDDEALIALDVEAMLLAAGFDVVAIARDAAAAHPYLDRGAADLVVLDAVLNGESAAPLAERLRGANIPFVVASGHAARQLPWLGDAPLVQKPFAAGELIAAVGRCLAAAARPLRTPDR